VFPVDAEWFERGGKQVNIWAGASDRVCQLGAGIDDVLAVVKHEENGLVAENVDD